MQETIEMAKEYDDLALVEAYKECNRCRIVAEAFGCSDETVRRALIKYGVPRVVKHQRPITKPKVTEAELRQIVEEYYSTNADINALAKKYHRSQTTVSKAIKTIGHGLKHSSVNSRKITDNELKDDAKTLNAVEIAKKYNMSVERVFRRAKNLGITLIPVEYGHWASRAKRYGVREFDKTITIDALMKRDNGICQICGEPVDPNDVAKGHARRNYPTLDHIIPLSKGGTHTWNNIQLAHMKCNSGKCDRITV